MKCALTRRERMMLAALKRALNWIDASSPGPNSSPESWATIHDDLIGVIQAHDRKWTPGDES
jgi:hypothetical protein